MTGNALENAVARLAEIDDLLSSLAAIQRERADLLKMLDFLRQYGDVPRAGQQAQKKSEATDDELLSASAAEVARRILSENLDGLTFRELQEIAENKGRIIQPDSLRRAMGKREDLFEKLGDGKYRLRSESPQKMAD